MHRSTLPERKQNAKSGAPWRWVVVTSSVAISVAPLIIPILTGNAPVADKLSAIRSALQERQILPKSTDGTTDVLLADSSDPPSNTYTKYSKG
jgi:hypothetical protein